ncbi:hypothetical protein TSUD_181550 [Trifolium subterraneum]|uniref:Uncharacterized protein n=1 Tax=Trifolium subterraneum TaxID=3900 RepID=A0A2Z6PSC6_TRISU|nr:hypothetical protein TSUD_181550 [Trifolium subterraneum]
MKCQSVSRCMARLSLMRVSSGLVLASAPQNPFTRAKTVHRDVNVIGNMSSHLDNNELHWSNRNVPRDPKFEFQNHKEIPGFSSFVVSTGIVLGIFHNIWKSRLLFINVPSLYKEHYHRLSIWLSLLDLFGLKLDDAALTSMQKAVLIFWLISFYLQPANRWGGMLLDRETTK